MNLPAAGRLAIYTAPGSAFRIERRPLRTPRGDEVLVRVSMSTICRSDIDSWQEHRPNPCPGVLGTKQAMLADWGSWDATFNCADCVGVSPSVRDRQRKRHARLRSPARQ